jgi:hypothetical protein
MVLSSEQSLNNDKTNIVDPSAAQNSPEHLPHPLQCVVWSASSMPFFQMLQKTKSEHLKEN